MNKTAMLAVLALFVVPFAPNVAACNGVITEIIVEDGSSAGQGFYIDDRSGGAATINHWIYKENNEIDNLQSGGPNTVLPDTIPGFQFFDDCNTYGAAGPDLLMF